MPFCPLSIESLLEFNPEDKPRLEVCLAVDTRYLICRGKDNPPLMSVIRDIWADIDNMVLPIRPFLEFDLVVQLDTGTDP